MRTSHRLLLVALAAANITGCAVIRDPRDAPWDPKHPSQMLDQIPAWEGSANRVCCGWRDDCEEKRLNRRC